MADKLCHLTTEWGVGVWGGRGRQGGGHQVYKLYIYQSHPPGSWAINHNNNPGAKGQPDDRYSQYIITGVSNTVTVITGREGGGGKERGGREEGKLGG